MTAQSSEILVQRAVEYVRQASYSKLTAILIALFWLFSFFRQQNPRVSGAKVHGYSSWFEPTFLLRIRFKTQAHQIIDSGYKKLKEVPFVVRRDDTDVTVLPIKYLDEICLIPKHKLSSKMAVIRSLLPGMTWVSAVAESDIIVKVLNNKLTPELNKYIDVAKSELEYGWHIDLPQPDDWTVVDIQHSVCSLAARMSAKITLGYPACRDPGWLEVATGFTSDIFMAAFILHSFPPWMHWLIAHFVPAQRRIKRQMEFTQSLIGDLMKQHVKNLEKGVACEDSLLNWMFDNGTEKEREISGMAGRQIMFTLASVHTTSSGVTNLLFDLCSHPEWIPILTEEVESVIKEYGVIGKNPNITTKQWLSKLEKMDSFFVESQRVHPSSLLSPTRHALVPLELKDGTFIPKHTRIAFAKQQLNNDPARIPHPDLFDPMRNYRKRQSGHGGDNLNKFTAGQTDSNYLSFGYGVQACPGRFFAVNEIKCILAKWLMEFEFKHVEGKPRPEVMYANDFVFVDPNAKLMVRKRKI